MSFIVFIHYYFWVVAEPKSRQLHKINIIDILCPLEKRSESALIMGELTL